MTLPAVPGLDDGAIGDHVAFRKGSRRAAGDGRGRADDLLDGPFGMSRCRGSGEESSKPGSTKRDHLGTIMFDDMLVQSRLMSG